MSIIEEAEKALRMKKYGSAVTLFRKAADEYPDNAHVCEGLAQSLLGAKVYEDAMLWSHKALDLNLELHLPHVVLAYVHYTKKNLAAFELEAKKAYQLNPNSAEVLTCYGIMLLVNKKLDECVLVLKKALELDSSNLVARANLSTAHFLAGNIKESYDQDKRMFRTNPSIRTGIRVLSGFHRAYPRLVTISLLLFILAGLFFHQEYFLFIPLAYFAYGFWLSIRLFMIRNWKSGISMLIYSALLLLILYLVFRAII